MGKEKVTPEDGAIYKLIKDYKKVDFSFSLEVGEAHQRIEKAGIPMNEDLYCSVIKLYQKNGLFEKADELHKLMIDKGIKPDNRIYSIQIIRDIKRGLIDKVRATINNIKQEDIQMGKILVVFNLTMKGLCDEKRYGMAKEIYQEMIAMGVKPSQHIYTTALALFGQLKDLEEVDKIAKDMRDFGPMDIVALNALLQAYMTGQPDKCDKIWEDMLESRVKPNHINYTKMISGYLYNYMKPKAKQMYEKAINDPTISKEGKQELKRFERKLYGSK